MRQALLVFYAILIGALLLVWGTETLLGPVASPFTGVAYGVIIFASAVGTGRIRARAAQRDRFEDPDSVEYGLVMKAKVGAFSDLSLGGVVIGALLLVLGAVPAGLAIIALVAAGLVSFFVRNAYLKRQLNAVR